MSEEEQAANSLENSPADRVAAYQWKPGQSGNPSGRPKKKLIDSALEDELAALDSDEAKQIAKALVQLAKKDVQAARLIAERTEGKPIQKVEHSGPDGGQIDTSITVRFVKP